MLTTFGWLYFGAGTLLFFFWVYGIFAFVRDCRRTYLPGLRRWLAARRASEDANEPEGEREGSPERNPEERLRELN